MPIFIKRPNGESTSLKNSDYLSAYYFFPKDLLIKCGRELASLPRIPAQAIHNKQYLKVIESDLFLLLMMDGFAHLVWPHMGIKGYREIYSGFEPAYTLAHSPAFWVQELLDRKIIPDPVELVKLWRDDEVGDMSWEEVSDIMSRLVPEVMEKHNMYEVIEIAKEFRCFEDFDYRDSNQKRDHFRKWYHTRTLHPMVSLEKMQINESDEYVSYDIHDESQDFEDKLNGQIFVEQFKLRLSEKDIQILTMRMDGLTYEEIATQLGYKNHSGVLKRITRISQSYLDFCDNNEINY